jgi:hypothetical protein
MAAQEHRACFFRDLSDKMKRGQIKEVAAHEEGMAMASEVLASVSRGAAEQIAEDAGLSLKQVEDSQRFFLCL